MSWTSVLTDLRSLLSDGPKDKISYRKRVLNAPDGVNLVFKTFEWRRLTDFTSSIAPEGLYKNGVKITPASDSPFIGEFTLTAPAPTSTDVLEGTYYYQWFQDSDLNAFLNYAVLWVQQGGTTDTVPQGLQPAVLKYAAADAYQDLAAKWAQDYSQTYKMEDAPNADRNSPMNQWLTLSKNYRKEATELRDQYYRRSGQALQPLTRSLAGRVGDIVPKR